MLLQKMFHFVSLFLSIEALLFIYLFFSQTDIFFSHCLHNASSLQMHYLYFNVRDDQRIWRDTVGARVEKAQTAFVCQHWETL